METNDRQQATGNSVNAGCDEKGESGERCRGESIEWKEPAKVGQALAPGCDTNVANTIAV